jgi:transcription initiation factor TFIID subunit 2
MSEHYANGERGFRVAHQTVSLDICLARQRIEGWTELTILPEHVGLRHIALDFRQGEVLEARVNGKLAHFRHDAFMSSPLFGPQSTVEQHHLYSQKIAPLIGGQLPGELVVDVPKGVRIVPQDPNSPLLSDGALYRELTIRVTFRIYGSTAGLFFVGGEQSLLKRDFLHAYTTHSPLGQATSAWLPCVDGLWETCTWRFEVSVPKSIGEVVREGQDNVTVEQDVNADAVEDLDNENDETLQEIVVVCSDTSPAEVCSLIFVCSLFSASVLFVPGDAPLPFC